MPADRHVKYAILFAGFVSSVFLNFIFQVGYDKEGLPIGLQLIGRPWAEATILRLASAVEVSSLILVIYG